MHTLLLVTIALSEGATSQEARDTVRDTLMNDNSFCGEGGRFGGPLCDWFVIGGRWSGLLAETSVLSAYRNAVIAKFPEFDTKLLSKALIDSHGPELDAIWRNLGGTGPSPYMRDGYRDFEDDAMLVTQALYDALLAKYAGEVGILEEFIDLDDESVEPGFVGRKWLVVVDYHN